MVSVTFQRPLLLAWFNLIPAWISGYTHYKVCNEITYPFPDFNRCTVEVWEWISNFIPHFTLHVITYPCWDLQFIYVSKRDPMCFVENTDLIIKGISLWFSLSCIVCEQNVQQIFFWWCKGVTLVNTKTCCEIFRSIKQLLIKNSLLLLLKHFSVLCINIIY